MVATNQRPTAEERKERKRLQNRLNQRARRQRIKDNNPNSLKQSYRVDRWRLAEDADSWAQPSRQGNRSSGQLTDDRQCSHDVNRHSSQTPTLEGTGTSKVATDALCLASAHAPHLPLPVDHIMIHLVSQNVCRGFIANKTILEHAANYIAAIQHPPLPPELVAGCEVAVIRPSRQIMPPCLLPTQLQMNSPHPTWIDMLPFPIIRDNLIKRQYMFDHKSFLRDLIGDLTYLMPPPPQGTLASTISAQMYQREDDNKPARSANGLILWGEPHIKESWEATPHFLTKWAWVVQGCDELVDVSNGWRTTRGENPIQKGGDGE